MAAAKMEEKIVHQDQRIGLALAVLLIGAAGAFFFRNDPKPVASSPRLKTARELDARIAEKANSPYNEERDGVAAKTVATPTDTDASQLPRLDVPDFFGPEQPVGETTRRNNEPFQDLAPIPVPDGSTHSGGRDHGEQVAKTAPANEKVHVVQKGETLSSIAAKEMGSSSRFHELFEANRDQLNDANDVRVGMSLRVPSRQTAKADGSKSRDRLSNSAPPLLPGDSSHVDSREFPAIPVDPAKQPPRSAENTPAKKKFEPVKRPPLGIKGLGTQSSEAAPVTKPARKLTQLPPSDGGGKVAR